MQTCSGSLQSLVAESAELTDLGTARVCRALQTCRSLQCLVLRGNAMAGLGAVELAVLVAGSGARPPEPPPPALLVSEGVPAPVVQPLRSGALHMGREAGMGNEFNRGGGVAGGGVTRVVLDRYAAGAAGMEQAQVQV